MDRITSSEFIPLYVSDAAQANTCTVHATTFRGQGLKGETKLAMLSETATGLQKQN